MRHNLRLGLIALPLAAVLPACAPAELASEVKVVNGTVASNGEHPAATIILYRGEPSVHCSAVWVSSNTLLTAAHCVIKPPDARFGPPNPFAPYAPWPVSDIMLENGVQATGVVYDETNWVAPRQLGSAQAEYEQAIASFAYDFAVVTFPEGSAPATLPIMETPAKPGDPLVIVGYGATNITPSGPPDRIKRYGNNTVKVAGDIVIFESPTSSAPNNIDRAGAAPGDSGGPLLVNNQLVGLCHGPANPPENLYPAPGTDQLVAYVSVQSEKSKATMGRAAAQIGARFSDAGATTTTGPASTDTTLGTATAGYDSTAGATESTLSTDSDLESVSTGTSSGTFGTTGATTLPNGCSSTDAVCQLIKLIFPGT